MGLIKRWLGIEDNANRAECLEQRLYPLEESLRTARLELSHISKELRYVKRLLDYEINISAEPRIGPIDLIHSICVAGYRMEITTPPKNTEDYQRKETKVDKSRKNK